RRLDAVKHLDNVSRGKSHPQSQRSQTPSFGKGLHDQEVGILAQEGSEARAGAKIYISLVHHHEPTKTIQNLENGLFFHFVSTRIIGGTDKYNFGEIIHLRKDFFCPKLKIFAQVYPFNSDIVDFGADLVHAISRREDDDIVLPRIAKGTEKQIDGLIAPIAQEDIGRRDILNPSDAIL